VRVSDSRSNSAKVLIYHDNDDGQRGLCETLLLLASGSLPGMCRKLVTRRIR